ncbi:hypothetical protein CR513_13456, partial [Mucuna pruriens]
MVNISNFNTYKSSNIKCFKFLGKGHISSQCLNKRIMILKDDGDIDSESFQEVLTLGSEGYLSEEVSYERDLLMVRRLMSMFIEDDQSQIDNIFHLRCMVNRKFCFLIIDIGISVNEILFDVFDKKVTHDGLTNKFSFVHKGNKVILKPLTPREVIEDQLKMKKKDREKGN